MSIICKTGCGQQVVYENIEFTDGFAYQCPHNLDNSLHYCPIFHSNSSLFGSPHGGHPFDANPYRENSYGNEIEKFGQIFYEFDELVISKNKNLSIEDIEIYKTRLQSFLNILPINGLYTDSIDGMNSIDKQSFEKAMESGALNDDISEYNNQQFYLTLSSSPLSALKKIYYILEGDSINFKKCQQLEKEISDNSPKNILNFEENPFELQLIEAQKQLEFFQNKLKNDVRDNDKENKIKDIIQYYHELIDGIPMGTFDTRKHIFNGVGSDGIKDNINRWYANKKRYLRCTAISEKLKISLDESEYFAKQHWDYMTTEDKEEWLNILDKNMGDKSKIVDLDYKKLEISHPKITNELMDRCIFGSDSSRQIAEDRLKERGFEFPPIKADNEVFDVVDGTDQVLFKINKIRELIFQNTHKDVEEIMEEILSTDDGETSSDISSEFKIHDPDKYDFNSHFNHNSIVHLLNTEKHIRKLIINQIYDCDINFLKKHFKQIWMDMENTKLRDGKNIRIPKEETELDYATFGQLLEILKNKETKNRVKIKKLDSHENLIQRIEIILPYRNQLDHGRGTINGDLEINTKCIVVGVCNEIDEYCTAILYQ
jgi:hypothetical protein